MGRSMTGPDVTDCLVMIRELEAQYQCRISVIMSPDGKSAGLPVSLCVVGIPWPPYVPWEPMGWSTEITWPNAENGTFWGAIYKALMTMENILEAARTAPGGEPF